MDNMENAAGKADVVCFIVTYNRLALLKEATAAVLGQNTGVADGFAEDMRCAAKALPAPAMRASTSSSWSAR